MYRKSKNVEDLVAFLRSISDDAEATVIDALELPKEGNECDFVI